MISLCVLCGDEASQLEDWLLTAAPAVDEIVLVDTTPERRNRGAARRAGARYLARPFTDFADLRQAALREATRPWVLVLDPDEEIDPAGLACVRRLAREDRAPGYRLPRHDYLGSGGWALSRPCRLFRRVPGVRYVGPVFEEPLLPGGVLPSGEAAGPPPTAWEVALHHRGFLRSESVLQRRRIRYLGLLQVAASAQPRAWVEAARALLLADAGDWNGAMASCVEALQHASRPEEPRLWLLRARCELARGETQQALESLTRLSAPEDWGAYERSRVENLRGLVLFAMDRVADAADAWSRAASPRLPIAAYWVNLAVSWRLLGDGRRADEALSRAAAANPLLAGRRPPAGGSPYQDTWVHRLDTIPRWAQLA